MKKLVALVLSLVLVLGVVAACNDDKGEATTTPAATKASDGPTEAVVTDTTVTGLQGDLTVWSFTNEIKTMTIAFKAANPDVNVTYVEIPSDGGEFRQKAIAAANTAECPDVIGLESAFVKEFVDSDMLYDLSDLKPYADALQVYANTIEVGTNIETGEIRAYSYQNTPGAVFYRRSLAKEYFGTDDPAEIQALMADMDKFTDMAAVVKEKSGGKTFMVSSVQEFRNTYFSNRTDPWFVDDTLVIDPKIDELFDIAKTFKENGYEAGAGQWSEGWFNGMKDALSDAEGNAIKIFCYFLPTWGLPYVLAPNAGDATKGDWGCVSGPQAYQWGGTWIGVMKNAKNPEVGKAFVQFCTLDETHLKNWATGVYTHDYLANIDPDLAGPAGDGAISQAAGDFICSQKLVEELIPTFDNSEMSAFLGGQNSYGGFAEAAPKCRADLFQGSDEAVQNALANPLDKYATGDLTKEAAIQEFKDAVAAAFPDKSV